MAFDEGVVGRFVVPGVKPIDQARSGAADHQNDQDDHRRGPPVERLGERAILPLISRRIIVCFGCIRLARGFRVGFVFVDAGHGWLCRAAYYMGKAAFLAILFCGNVLRRRYADPRRFLAADGWSSSSSQQKNDATIHEFHQRPNRVEDGAIGRRRVEGDENLVVHDAAGVVCTLSPGCTSGALPRANRFIPPKQLQLRHVAKVSTANAASSGVGAG